MIRNLDILLKHKALLFFLILANMAGFAFSLYYYIPQLTETSWYYWIFVVDSPLYLILFAFICFLLHEKRNIPNWIVYLTSIGLIKVGFWTLLVLTIHFEYFSAMYPLITILNFPLYLGMLLEGLLLARNIKTSVYTLGTVMVWFLINQLQALI